jgi:hypothetical protein
MQAVIATFVLAVYFGSHRQWAAPAMFFVMMELGALWGAWWANRLKQKYSARGW